MEYANLCTFISYLISYLRASEKIFNLQIYVCGMLKHFSKLCSKKPQKSSPEFSRLCGRPPLPSRGGGQHATVTCECVRQCVRLPSRAWCHQDSAHWLPSRCTSHSPPAPYPYRECISKVCPVSQQKWAYHDWYGLFLPIWCQHWDCTLYDFATFHTKNGCNRLILSSYPSSDFIEIKSPLKNYFFFSILFVITFQLFFLSYMYNFLFVLDFLGF